jgi:hypothetical protein
MGSMSTVATETELTPEIVGSVVSRTEEGMHPDRAAGEIGVAKATFDAWLERGMNDAMEEKESLERELVERVYVADCQAEGKWFNGLQVRTQSGRYINDFLAFMARRWPERWVERKPEAGGERRFEDDLSDFLRTVETVRAIDHSG